MRSLICPSILAAVFTVASASNLQPSSAIQWVNCADNIPTPLQGVQLPNTLPSTLKCGRLEVPMDYSKPISALNNITLGFAMYRPKNSKGLINFNDGGPGVEVAEFAWVIALNLTAQGASWFAGVEDFDFLAMDVRGTYSSNNLNCSAGNLTIPSSFPSTQAEFEQYHAVASAYAKSCVDSPKGILQHVSTKETIEDWNSLRAVLGYEKMNFLALSYGTYGATGYAHKYPQYVGNFVLDAVEPRGLSVADTVAGQVQAANRLLLRSDAYCMNDTSCPFYSQGKGAVVEAFNSTLNRAIAGNSTNVTGDDFRAMVVLGYFSYRPNFPALNNALYLALNGNWSAFDYNGFAQAFTTQALHPIPTICSDEPVGNNTLAEFIGIKNQGTKNDTYQFQYAEDLVIAGLCGGWPYHAQSNDPLPNNLTMVLVSADFDLDTPTEYATFTSQQLPKSGFIVRHGDDHETFYVPGPARSLEFEFLTTGKLPSTTNETYVTYYAPGSTRGPIPDPYSVPVGPLAGDIYST